MKTGKLILLLLLAQFSYGQNNVLNTWAFHEHSDTNIFLSIGALGRTVQSNITAGTWYDGNGPSLNAELTKNLNDAQMTLPAGSKLKALMMNISTRNPNQRADRNKKPRAKRK